MNYRESKIGNFIESISKKQPDNIIEIIVGNNGSGKTKSLINRYIHEKNEKIYISEDYPILLKKIMNIVKQTGYLGEIIENLVDIQPRQITNINMMVGKKYSKIKFSEIDIDFFKEKFQEIDIEMLFGDENIDFERYFERSFYYILVEDDSGNEYDVFGMGTGEFLSIVYFLLMTDPEKKQVKYYIDEPCNYLSSLCIDNFTKLMIESMRNRKNEYVFTTNSHEIIDRLVYYGANSQLYLVSKQVETRLEYDTYVRLFSDRYKALLPMMKNKVTVFVEDILAQKYINQMIPVSIKEFVEILYVNGESELNRILNSKETLEKFELINESVKVLAIFDGDQKKNEDDLCNDKVGYLPFENVEQEVKVMFENGEGLFTDRSAQNIIENIYTVSEIHDTYYKVIAAIEHSELELIDSICDKYSNENAIIIESIQNILNK